MYYDSSKEFKMKYSIRNDEEFLKGRGFVFAATLNALSDGGWRFAYQPIFSEENIFEGYWEKPQATTGLNNLDWLNVKYSLMSMKLNGMRNDILSPAEVIEVVEPIDNKKKKALEKAGWTQQGKDKSTFIRFL